MLAAPPRSRPGVAAVLFACFRLADGGNCSSRFAPPEQVPLQATDHNGVVLQEVCINTPGPEYEVYAIGDWGGIVFAEIPHMPPIPADKRSRLFPSFARDFVYGVDDRAQLLVAEQMRLLALTNPPDYLLNVGDNFYWGGIEDMCGKPPFEVTGTQFKNIFENVYWGTGLEGKTWLGVLGNHDYGGYHFVGAWDQAIGYSWGRPEYSTGRWLTAAQYWLQKVNYPTFSVEYYMMDSNIFEVWPADVNGGHNICGAAHNPRGATCGSQGPHSLQDCGGWFAQLWEKQLRWLEEHLAKSAATWQVVVTHFPPRFGITDWSCIADRYGLDLHIAGHIHYQQVTPANAPSNPLGATALVITGGGGGITSESPPDVGGADDAYGFVRVTLSAQNIRLTAISHGGVVRSTTDVQQRRPNAARARCSPEEGPAGHFELVGGKDHGCRSLGGDLGSDFQLFASVPSMLACQRHCQLTSFCRGVEFGNQACKVFVAPVTNAVPVPGYECMRLVSRHGEAQVLPEVSPTDAETVRKELHGKLEVGKDRACRGKDEADISPKYFTRHPDAPTLMGCERLCLNNETCRGIEYGPGTLCKLWDTSIRASVHREGVACLPRRAGGVDLVELAGQLHQLHV